MGADSTRQRVVRLVATKEVFIVWGFILFILYVGFYRDVGSHAEAASSFANTEVIRMIASYYLLAIVFGGVARSADVFSLEAWRETLRMYFTAR